MHKHNLLSLLNQQQITSLESFSLGEEDQHRESLAAVEVVIIILMDSSKTNIYSCLDRKVFLLEMHETFT